MTSLTASDLPPPPPEDVDGEQGSADRIARANSGVYSSLSGWFDTKSTSVFRKERCYVVLQDHTISIYSNDKEKKPRKVFSFDESDVCVDTTTGKGYCLTIIDNGKKKDQIMLIGESQEYIEKWSTGILKNKTQTNYEKRRASLNRVQNQGKLFDELWAAEDDEDEDGQDGASNTNGSADPKVESGKGVYPPEHEGWLMKQGGTFKSWKHRYMVLSHFCLSYYASEEHYKEGKKAKR